MIIRCFFVLLSIVVFSANSAFACNYSQAQSLIKKAQVASTQEESFEYLHKARNLLLEECNENPLHINALEAMSKVNQMLGDRKEAKVYILKAFNLNPTNPNLQKAMGDFYFNFQEYSTAIEYYKLSLGSGNLRDFQTNLQTAKCYEKLGDIENSELYYKICGMLNSSSREVKNKLNLIETSYMGDNSEELDNLKYKYLFKKRPKNTEEKNQEEVDFILDLINGLE